MSSVLRYSPEFTHETTGQKVTLRPASTAIDNTTNILEGGIVDIWISISSIHHTTNQLCGQCPETTWASLYFWDLSTQQRKKIQQLLPMSYWSFNRNRFKLVMLDSPAPGNRSLNPVSQKWGILNTQGSSFKASALCCFWTFQVVSSDILSPER